MFKVLFNAEIFVVTCCRNPGGTKKEAGKTEKRKRRHNESSSISESVEDVSVNGEEQHDTELSEPSHDKKKKKWN